MITQTKPIHEFKMSNPGDDWSITMTVFVSLRGFQLRRFVRKSHIPVGQADFPSIKAAETWARQAYRFGEKFE